MNQQSHMKLRNLTAALLSILTIGLASCNRDRQLLDTVPADAAMVMVLDAERLTGYMNGKAYGGQLNADQVIDRFLVKATARSRNEIKTLLTSDAIDRHSIVGFSAKGDSHSVVASIEKGDFFYTFDIKDAVRLTADLDAGSPTSIDGYDAYQLEGATLFVKDKQGWIAWGDPAVAARKLDSQIDIASNTAISSVDGISRFLSSGNGVLLSAMSMELTGEQGWICTTADIDDAGKQLLVNADYLDHSGKKAQMDKYLKDIDTDMLSFTTPSDMFVMAVGIKQDTDWEGLFNYISAIYPLDARKRGALALALPYLKRIDGTLLIAAGATADNRLSRSNFSSDLNFVVAVKVAKNQAKTTLKDFAGVASLTGIPMIEKDGTYILQARGMSPVTMKIVDGSTVVIANRSLEQLGNDSAAKVMKGNSFALWANIPEETAEAMYGGRGFKLTMTLDGNFQSTFSFNGSSAPLLEQLATSISDNTDERPVEMNDADNTLGFTPLDTIR